MLNGLLFFSTVTHANDYLLLIVLKRINLRFTWLALVHLKIAYILITKLIYIDILTTEFLYKGGQINGNDCQTQVW